MLSSRKSMNNLMETAQGPFLVHFRYWFQTRIKQSNNLRIQFGKRPFCTLQNCAVGQKNIIMDIAMRNTMPICKIESTDGVACIQLKKYQPGLLKQYSVNVGKLKFYFSFQLLTNTQGISSIYTSDKTSDDERLKYGQSVQDLIRSEAQFLSKFQKEIENVSINKQDKIEADIEQKLSAELVSIKPIQLNFKIIITLFVLFMAIGYLIASPQPIKKKNRRKSVKKSK